MIGLESKYLTLIDYLHWFRNLQNGGLKVSKYRLTYINGKKPILHVIPENPYGRIIKDG